MTALACIVGSGFSTDWVNAGDGQCMDTPFGPTSSPIVESALDGVSVAILARHGFEHRWAPHDVNYRANVWALREIGITHCIGVNVVGGIAPELPPGTLAVPHQLIDYTWGRAGSFDDVGTGVTHIEFTDPFSACVRAALLDGCVTAGLPSLDGVYGVTQGPRLETSAEIDRLERDGCAMVGMTAMPEAALAREAGIEYALLAGVVNHAAGRTKGRSLLSEMREVLASVMTDARRVSGRAVAVLAAADL